MASEEEDDRLKHAADDPTAVWDEDSLRKAGFDEIAKKAAAEAAAAAPASRKVPPPPPTAPAPARGGLSWTVTLFLAAAVGLAVYVAVRLLR